MYNKKAGCFHIRLIIIKAFLKLCPGYFTQFSPKKTPAFIPSVGVFQKENNKKPGCFYIVVVPNVTLNEPLVMVTVL